LPSATPAGGSGGGGVVWTAPNDVFSGCRDGAATFPHDAAQPCRDGVADSTNEAPRTSFLGCGGVGVLFCTTPCEKKSTKNEASSKDTVWTVGAAAAAEPFDGGGDALRDCMEGVAYM
jgi:hypothetical protein